jgi:beta-lactamase class A
VTTSKETKTGLARSRPVRLASIALVMAATIAGCTPADGNGSAQGTGSSSGPSAGPSAAPSTATPPAAVDLSPELSDLELRFDARLGIRAVDTGTGRTVSYRADERFGYASTLKVFAAAEFLRTVPPAERDVVTTWTQADIDAAGYSPVTTEHLATGLAWSELAEAAVRSSDNTALNLVLGRIGGPGALDAGLEALGDDVTEVVNLEPALNTIEAGSTEDTTTPAAFAADLEALLEGSSLAETDLRLLVEWMSGNATGDALVRAGAPAGWTVADKSGGAGGIRNDIAIVTPPGRSAIVLTVFSVKNGVDAKYDDALVAAAAEVVLARF